jgi:hypothetical protein
LENQALWQRIEAPREAQEGREQREREADVQTTFHHG